jgi:hypothetical protein
LTRRFNARPAGRAYIYIVAVGVGRGREVFAGPSAGVLRSCPTPCSQADMSPPGMELVCHRPGRHARAGPLETFALVPLASRSRPSFHASLLVSSAGLSFLLSPCLPVGASVFPSPFDSSSGLGFPGLPCLKTDVRESRWSRAGSTKPPVLPSRGASGGGWKTGRRLR